MRRGLAVSIALLVACSMAWSSPVAIASQEEESAARFAGSYEADIPDMGVMMITVTHNDEDGTLTIAAEAQPATEMEHIKANRYKIETYEFGAIYIEFLEDDQGEVTSMAIDGYDFSFIAIKVG